MQNETPVLAGTQPASEVIRLAPVWQAPNGVSFAARGENALPAADLQRMVSAVPALIAAALEHKAYYFVPLTISEGEHTLVAERYEVGLSDRATCHRNVTVGNSQCVFISTRLMDDKFSVAFEFYINVAHPFVEKAGVPQAFSDLVWKQAEAGVRGETSADAQELRKLATHGSLAGEHVRKENNGVGNRKKRFGFAVQGAFAEKSESSPGPAGADRGSQMEKRVDEKAKSDYLQTAFSDAIAIYMLSLYLDVDYYDLREREYPLLAPSALAERLRYVGELFPPNAGFEFAIHYKRRT